MGTETEFDFDDDEALLEMVTEQFGPGPSEQMSFEGLDEGEDEETVSDADGDTVSDVDGDAEADDEGAHPEEGGDEVDGDGSEDEDTESSEDVDNEVEVEESAETEGSEAEGSSEARRLTLKINGVEREYDESEVVAMAQRVASADEKFRQAAELSKENESLVEFARDFESAWSRDPASAVADLFEQIEGDEGHAEALGKILTRSLALGRMPQRLREALQLNDEAAASAKVEYQRDVLARREQELQQRELQASAGPVDAFGYTTAQYREIMPQILEDAGIDPSDVEAGRQFISEFVEFRLENNIADPFRALARFQSQRAQQQLSEAQLEAARAQARAAAARTPAKKAKRLPGGAVPSGQVPDSAPEPIGFEVDDEKAAIRALREAGLI